MLVLSLLVLNIIIGQNSMTIIGNCMVAFILVIVEIVSKFCFIQRNMNFLSVEWSEFERSYVRYNSIFEKQSLI